jgi:hypothetical protein
MSDKELDNKPGSIWTIPNYNREILEKAIQKAIDDGWDVSHFCTIKGYYKHPDESEFNDILGTWHNISPLDIIFNHDFAKALWGEAQPTRYDVFADKDGNYNVDKNYGWKYHLQAMVVADNPIKYLEVNL